ncbi:MAG: hypothetical protein LBU22_04290 [Dysgonamonadaceae bacterium]|jgi:hypothetical protein|nr:hypothetical protein [Dysgonamonadaceae bacterium]
MNLFKKLSGKKEENTTLMLLLFLFEDFDHTLPEDDKESYDRFATPIMLDVIKLHYYEELKPLKKWNYDYLLNTNDLRKQETSHLEFRDTNTKEINDRAKYKDMCNGLKSGWKNILISRFPKYNREKLEDGFEKIQFDYFPSKCLLVASFLLDNIIEMSVHEFRPPRT